MTGARSRLALLVVGLIALWTVFGPLGLLPAGDVRDVVQEAGPLAPIAFVLISSALGALLVPGALLAGVAGILFGSALGAAASLAAATLTAAVALVLARRIGRPGAEQVAPDKLASLGGWLERHGFAAVVVARLAPSVPDAPVTYAMGLTRIKLRSVVLGTLVGAAPRAFAYATIGAELEDLSSPLALTGFAVLVASMVAGAVLVAVHARRGVTRS